MWSPKEPPQAASWHGDRSVVSWASGLCGRPGRGICSSGRRHSSRLPTGTTLGERRTPWAPHADALVSQRSAKGLFWMETGQYPPWMVLPPYTGPGCSISAPRVPLPPPCALKLLLASVWLGVVSGRAWPVSSLLALVAQQEEEGVLLGTGWMEVGLGGRG